MLTLKNIVPINRRGPVFCDTVYNYAAKNTSYFNYRLQIYKHENCFTVTSLLY